MLNFKFSINFGCLKYIMKTYALPTLTKYRCSTNACGQMSVIIHSTYYHTRVFMNMQEGKLACARTPFGWLLKRDFISTKTSHEGFMLIWLDLNKCIAIHISINRQRNRNKCYVSLIFFFGSVISFLLYVFNYNMRHVF